VDSQKKKTPKALTMDEKIDNTNTRFYNEDIDRPELL
jgi:hypothetical protein